MISSVVTPSRFRWSIAAGWASPANVPRNGLGHVWERAGKAAHVQFIEDCVRPRNAPPLRRGDVRRNRHGLGREGSAVQSRGGEKALMRPERPVQRQGVRVEQQFVRVEAQALVRSPGAVGAKAVKRARAEARNEAVKDRASAARQDMARDLLRAARVEQAEFELFRRFGRDGDVGPVFGERQAERFRRTGKQGRRAQAAAPEEAGAMSRKICA